MVLHHSLISLALLTRSGVIPRLLPPHQHKPDVVTLLQGPDATTFMDRMYQDNLHPPDRV